MKTICFFLLASISVLFSCEKPEVRSDSNDYFIKAGFYCGWGTGADSIEISRTMIRYVYYVPSRSPLPQIDKSRSVSDSELTSILHDFNYNDFVKLNYQSCNVCVDGCDEWILIKEEQSEHQIRFGKGARIDTIGKLQDKLAQLRLEFSH